MRAFVALAAILGIATAAQAEPPNGQPRVLFSHLAKDRLETKAEVATLRRNILLRPLAWNDKDPQVFQEVYAYVWNPTDDPLEKFSVQITGLGGKLESDVLTVPSDNAYHRVVFKRAAPPPPAAPPPLKSEKFPESLNLKVSWAAIGGGMESAEQQAAVDLFHPSEYVSVRGIEFRSEGEGKNELQVTLDASPLMFGPACRVEVVLKPRYIEGLLGDFEQLMGVGYLEPGKKETLVAKGFRFQESSPRRGRVYINVDGYERAYIYETTFEKRTGTVQPVAVRTPWIRFRDPASQADAPLEAETGAPWRVVLEPENLPANVVYQVKLGNLKWERTGARRRQLWVQGFAEGRLLIRGEVTDWVLETQDTKELRGTVPLEATVERGATGNAGAPLKPVTWPIKFVPQLSTASIAITDKRRLATGNTLELELNPTIPNGKPAGGIVVYDRPLEVDQPPKMKKQFVAEPAPNKPGRWIVRLEIPPGDVKSMQPSATIEDSVGKKYHVGMSKVDIPEVLVDFAVLVRDFNSEGFGGVLVTMTNTTTKEKFEKTTDGDGKAAFRLPPGDYKIEPKKDGFFCGQDKEKKGIPKSIQLGGETGIQLDMYKQ